MKVRFWSPGGGCSTAGDGGVKARETATPQGKVGTHGGGDVDEEGVAVDAHGLQEGVASHLPFGPLPPGQETPQSDGHQPGVQEDDQRRYRHCRTAQDGNMTRVVARHNQRGSESRTDLGGTAACSGTRGRPVC